MWIGEVMSLILAVRFFETVTYEKSCSIQRGRRWCLRYRPLKLFSTSCDGVTLTFDPPTSKWSFHALALLTTCSSWHQNRLFFSKYCIYKFGNRRMYGQTNKRRLISMTQDVGVRSGGLVYGSIILDPLE